MSSIFDLLIIETYTELAWAVGLVVGLILGLAAFRRYAARERRGTTQSKPAAAVRIDPIVAPVRVSIFERIAAVICHANDRAAAIAEMQAAAAIKLDSSEMAVHRLRADLDQIMTLPRSASRRRPERAGNAVTATHLRPAMPLPDPMALAA